MAGLKEFAERIKSDAAFKAKFAGIDSEDKLLSTARAEGYDLEQISDEDLENVAGGVYDGDVLDRNTDGEILTPAEREQQRLKDAAYNQRVNIYIKLVWKTIFG